MNCMKIQKTNINAKYSHHTFSTYSFELKCKSPMKKLGQSWNFTLSLTDCTARLVFYPLCRIFFLPQNSNKNDDVISLGIAVDILKVPSLFSSNFTNMMKSILFLLAIS